MSRNWRLIGQTLNNISILALVVPAIHVMVLQDM